METRFGTHTDRSTAASARFRTFTLIWPENQQKKRLPNKRLTLVIAPCRQATNPASPTKKKNIALINWNQLNSETLLRGHTEI